MRILVTGGAGFIGSNLCLRFLNEGHTVVAVDNLITSTGKNILPLKKHPQFQFIRHDICKPLPSLGRFDNIYHLACPTGVPNVVSLAQEILLTCSLGTHNMLALARKHQAAFLLTSSSEVYGDPQQSPQKESYTGNVDPVGIRSSYEEGKRFAESLTIMYARKYGVDGKIVRIFNTFGPHMSPTDTRVIPRFLTQALTGKPMTIHGTGMQKRTFCYVDDLIIGLFRVMEKGKKGEVYNLGSDRQVTMKELARTIIALTASTSSLTSIPRPSHDPQSRLPDLTRIRSLGWSSKDNLKDGLRKTIQWYKSFH